MVESENIIDVISESWGWSGIKPEEIISDNAFGNLIIKDTRSMYWRICPEDVYCKIVAKNPEDLKALSADAEFLEDWNMEALLHQAQEALGDLSKGQKYCLVIPSVLGGQYDVSNIKIAPLREIIGVSGDIGKQITDLPDGSKIRLKVVD